MGWALGGCLTQMYDSKSFSSHVMFLTSVEPLLYSLLIGGIVYAGGSCGIMAPFLRFPGYFGEFDHFCCYPSPLFNRPTPSPPCPPF